MAFILPLWITAFIANATHVQMSAQITSLSLLVKKKSQDLKNVHNYQRILSSREVPLSMNANLTEP